MYLIYTACSMLLLFVNISVFTVMVNLASRALDAVKSLAGFSSAQKNWV